MVASIVRLQLLSFQLNPEFWPCYRCHSLGSAFISLTTFLHKRHGRSSSMRHGLAIVVVGGSNPKFSIKTEVLGGGGVQWQWQRLRLTAPPPPCASQLMLFF